MGSACSSDNERKYDVGITGANGQTVRAPVGPSVSARTHHARLQTRGESIAAGDVGTPSAVAPESSPAVPPPELRMDTLPGPEPPTIQVGFGALEVPAESKPRRLDAAQLEKLKIGCLQSSVFGECMTAEQMQLLAQLSELKKWSHVGDRICEQHTAAGEMFIVQKGEVLLEVTDPALDTRANQLAVARTLAETHAQPIEEDDGTAAATPRPYASPPKTPTAQASGATTPARGAQSHGQRPPHLTRAELIAIEAAAMIEQETLNNDGLDGLIAAGGDAADEKDQPQQQQTTRDHLKNPSGHVSLSFTHLDASPSVTGRTIAGVDPELASLMATIPSTYTSPNTMFVSVKNATHIFGHGMFFSGGRYKYSAVNNSLSTHLLVVPRAAFEELWTKWPDSRGPLMKHLGESLEDALVATSWLSNTQVVPPHKLTMLTSLFHHASTPAHTTLFEEGDLCTDESTLYYILEGSVDLTLTNEKGHKSTKTLNRGSLFGELGVMLGFPITATAVTTSACIFRLCKRRWLNLFAMMVPQLMPTLRQTLAEYHIRDEQLLHHPHVQEAFTEFSLKEYNGENIEFLSQAIRFRKVVFPNPAYTLEDVLNEAAMLYNRYISESSVLQINTKQIVRSEIKDTLQAGHVTRNLFLAAEREICQLILQDSFLRFKLTPLYSQALSQLAPPAPAPILLNYPNTSEPVAQLLTRGTNDRDSLAAGATLATPSHQHHAPHHSAHSSYFQRHLSLDEPTTTGDSNGGVHIPLMFGGGVRAHAMGTPLAGHERLQIITPKSSVDLSPRTAAQPTHTPRTTSVQFLSAQSAGGSTTPQLLTLSPATDKFRLNPRGGGEPISPTTKLRSRHAEEAAQSILFPAHDGADSTRPGDDPTRPRLKTNGPVTNEKTTPPSILKRTIQTTTPDE